jgi:FkbM family methyltransferase
VDCAKKVYSFEPTPKHFELLKEFTNDFNVIIPVNIAISDSDGYIPFYLSDTNTTMNSILNKYEKEITVKGQSIISFLKENNIEKVDFIKCDIEGSEMIALKEECVRPLFDIVDKWFIEVHATSHGNIPQNREVLKQNFEKVGYTCQCIGYDSLYVFKT